MDSVRIPVLNPVRIDDSGSDSKLSFSLFRYHSERGVTFFGFVFVAHDCWASRVLETCWYQVRPESVRSDLWARTSCQNLGLSYVGPKLLQC